MGVEYQRVLIAIDRSDDWQILVERGLQIAERWGARVSLLHVVDQRELLAGGEAMVPLFGLGTEGDKLDQRVTEPQSVALSGDERVLLAARAYLEAVADRVGRPDLERHVRTSSAIGEEIAAVAGAVGADLLVCGARHRHGLALFLPSAVDGVVHRLPCDLVLVKVG